MTSWLVCQWVVWVLIGLVLVQLCCERVGWLWLVLCGSMISFLASSLLASHKSLHSRTTTEAPMLRTPEQCNQNVSDLQLCVLYFTWQFPRCCITSGSWKPLKDFNATLCFCTFSCPHCLLLSLRIFIPQEEKLKNKCRRRPQATDLSENDIFFSLENDQPHQGTIPTNRSSLRSNRQEAK